MRSLRHREKEPDLDPDRFGYSRNEHKIPPIMQFLPIGTDESPARCLKGMIALSTKFLESGLTSLLSDTLQILLHHVGLTSGQLNLTV